MLKNYAIGRREPNMINAWWLVLIIPVSVFVGIWLVSMLIVGRSGDYREDTCSRGFSQYDK